MQDALSRWEKKFANVIKWRQAEKARIEKRLGADQDLKNVNQRPLAKNGRRPQSRYSTRTFGKIDFYYNGNTEWVSIF